MPKFLVTARVMTMIEYLVKAETAEEAETMIENLSLDELMQVEHNPEFPYVTMTEDVQPMESKPWTFDSTPDEQLCPVKIKSVKES